MPPNKNLVWNEICDLCHIKHSVNKNAQCNYKNIFKLVMIELLKKIPKDTHRKVCKGCHDIGHNMKELKCKLNIEKNVNLKNKIKTYMLSLDCLSGKTNDEHFNELTQMYGITINLCKTLYDEISPIELCNRNHDINLYMQKIKETTKVNCHHCHKDIFNIQLNTHRIWKENIICDSCWSDYCEERDLLWTKIKQYKEIQCCICTNTKLKEGERYHYDHINMFNKGNSICSMVNEGNNIDDIYIEIDKCQILCLTCHHMVTDIESNLGFTRIKQILTRKLNNDEITEEEYMKQKIEIGEIYIKKMHEIYNELKKNYIIM